MPAEVQPFLGDVLEISMNFKFIGDGMVCLWRHGDVISDQE